MSSRLYDKLKQFEVSLPIAIVSYAEANNKLHKKNTKVHIDYNKFLIDLSQKFESGSIVIDGKKYDYSYNTDPLFDFESGEVKKDKCIEAFLVHSSCTAEDLQWVDEVTKHHIYRYGDVIVIDMTDPDYDVTQFIDEEYIRSFNR